MLRQQAHRQTALESNFNYACGTVGILFMLTEQ